MGILGGVGAAQSFASTSGGKIHAFNNMSTTPQVVLPINAFRVSITFHNPHTSIDMFVTQSVDFAGTTLSPTTSALGGCFRIFAGATLTLSGEVQGAWQGFSVSGSALPFTAMESNL